MRLLSVKICLLAVLATVSCGRGPGVDTDGDGLSDLQELLFGSDPAVVDTDHDGVPDGRDDNLFSPDPAIRLTASPAFQDEQQGRCVVVGIRAIDGRGFPVAGARVDLSWGLGDLQDVVTDESGFGNVTVCWPQGVDTKFMAKSRDLGGRHPEIQAELELSLHHLVVPGVNTSPWEGAGKIDGRLKVVALYRNRVGLLKPFQGASVHVGAEGVQIPFMTTGPEGVVDFVVPGLKGPVDVTVGAPGHRYVTYFRTEGSVISVILDPLDVISEDAVTGFGTISGKVKGFFGEGGGPKFPPGILITDPRTPVAIVQLAINGRPLSSMSMGGVLEEPSGTGIWEAIPSNMAVCQISSPDQKDCGEEGVFTLRNIPEGQHLVFALGGTVGDVVETVQDPYQLDFQPLALGISRVSVVAGAVTEVEILMNIDLSPESGETVDITVDDLPIDWKTGQRMPNALIMPVIDTGGEGFIFVSVDGSYNRGIRGPVKVRFPDPDHPEIKKLGLKLTNLAVGLAGRKAYLAGDPPGISTPVRPGVKAPAQINFDGPGTWLEIPRIEIPAPVPDGVSLDTVSEDVFDGTVTFRPVADYTTPDLYVLRLNYLTAAPRNTFCADRESGVSCSLGGPRSHALWEMFVPPDMTTVTLPTFPPGFPTPYLGNPDPTPAASTSPHRFDADTIEVELSAYVLGADGKPFDYDDNFAYQDVNMHCTVVSQDSVAVRVK